MTIFPHTYTRDFPVLLSQIWGRRYLNIFDTTVNATPRNVYIHENGLMKLYRNPLVQKEINSILLTKLAQNKDFIKEYLKELEEKFLLAQKSSERPIATKDEFIRFVKLIHDCWPAHYISIFLPLDERFSEDVCVTAMDFRRKYDQLEFQTFNQLDASRTSLYGGLPARYIYIDEILQNLIPETAALQERAQTKLFIFDDQITSESDFKGLEKRFDFSLESENSVAGISEIKGQIAHRGKVTGVVRILLKKEDISSFEEGRVLVTSMTIPTFLPAMHKAIAFVTDEGGITCHAAIVAREMKKPCIIGTKIATKVFKDGDLVEVDADSGIVRKL